MSNIFKVQLKQPERINEFIARCSFELEPYQNNRSLAINLDETKQELDSLFSTRKYERPYQPDYYNPLDELIGELWGDEVQDIAITSIVNKINKFIPYLIVDQSRTAFSYSNYMINMELVFAHEYDFNRTLYNYERQFDTIT